MKLVPVDFACNGDGGYFDGNVGWISAYGCDLEWCGLRDPAFTVKDGWFRLHRQKFRFEASQEWVGNWCWNRYWLARSEYRRLIRTLSQAGWHCTGGIARWSDAFDNLAQKPVAV